MRRGAGPPGGRPVVRRGQLRVPSARRPISQTQQASSRATAAFALHELLPAAASASRRRQSLAVQSSARARIAAGTSAVFRQEDLSKKSIGN